MVERKGYKGVKRMRQVDALERLAELEREAKNKYCEQVEWKVILECLPDKEIREWKRLYKIAYGKEW